MKAVYKIKDFNGVGSGVPDNPGDADKLERGGIKTVDDLWRCVGVNFDKGIAKVSAKTAVEERLIYALLIADSLGESRHRVVGEPFGVWSIPKRSWLSLKRLWYARERHWLEMTLGAATLLLAALAIRAGYVKPRVTEQVVVRPSSRLLPFQSLRPEDIMLKSTPREAGAFESIEKVVGRYPARAVAPGTTLLEEQLVAEDIGKAMGGRRVLSIPVNPRTISPTLAAPAHVWLLLSPRATGEKEPQPVLLKDLILLSINRQGDGASVEMAVTDDCLKMMEPLLGGAEAFVLQPASENK